MIGTMFSCLLLTLGLSQNSEVITNSQHRTFAEDLSSYGIDLSRQSLVAALSNKDPKVRSLAANQLVQDGDQDAIPSIEAALAIEKDPHARMGIAAALSAVPDSKGVESLQAMCNDTTLPFRMQLAAVQTLQIAHSPSGVCADAMLGSLNRAEDAGYRDVILTVLPAMYIELPRDQSGRIVSLVEELLRDRAPQSSVRIAASSALAQIGSASSVEVIRAAIVREQDPVVRSSLEGDLVALEKK